MTPLQLMQLVKTLLLSRPIVAPYTLFYCFLFLLFTPSFYFIIHLSCTLALLIQMHKQTNKNTFTNRLIFFLSVCSALVCIACCEWLSGE